MAGKLFDQVGGIIKVTVKGKNLEKIINIASTRGIYIWDIKKNGDSMNLRVRSSGFDALKTIADENGFNLEIIEKQGLPFFTRVIKRRLGFVSGALIFVLALYLMSSFVWFIELSGNKKVDSSKILVTAAKYGIYKGAAKWNFSRENVEEGILKDINELSYVRIDIRGVKAKIEVVEKILPHDEITGPCNIVANKDGVIHEMLVLEGEARVKEGDVVGKGDILISGMIFPPQENTNDIFSNNESIEQEIAPQPYTVRARGIIKARVWYEGYGECKLRTSILNPTGNRKTNVYLETPWKSFKIRSFTGDLFTHYRKDTKINSVNTPAGEFAVKKVDFYELVEEKKVYTENQALNIARQKAMEKMRNQMGENNQPNDVKVEVLSSPSDDILRVKVSVETIEDIALAESIK